MMSLTVNLILPVFVRACYWRRDHIPAKVSIAGECAREGNK